MHSKKRKGLQEEEGTGRRGKDSKKWKGQEEEEGTARKG